MLPGECPYPYGQQAVLKIFRCSLLSAERKEAKITITESCPPCKVKYLVVLMGSGWKKREYQNAGRVRSTLTVPSGAYFIKSRIHKIL